MVYSRPIKPVLHSGLWLFLQVELAAPQIRLTYHSPERYVELVFPHHLLLWHKNLLFRVWKHSVGSRQPHVHFDSVKIHGLLKRSIILQPKILGHRVNFMIKIR